MKLVNIFSMMGLVMMAAACGSSQPTTGVYANGYNPYGSTGYPSTGTSGYGTSQALYNSTGQLIGYKTSTSLIAGSASVQAGNNAYFPVNVNAGDKISYNLSNAAYKINETSCLGGFLNFGSSLHTAHDLTTGSVTFNGQPITSGTVAPTSGVVAFIAQLDPLSANCSVRSYFVYLPYGVTKDSCTNVNGTAMQCP